MNKNYEGRVWLARKPGPLLDNASVTFDASGKTLFIDWVSGGVRGGGHLERKLARLLAKRILEALQD
jgi:hypothetical protein